MCLFSPGSNEIQEVLPAVIDFVEFLLNFSGFACVTGSGQALSQLVQLQLVFLRHSDLLLVVLIHSATQASDEILNFKSNSRTIN